MVSATSERLNCSKASIHSPPKKAHHAAGEGGEALTVIARFGSRSERLSASNERLGALAAALVCGRMNRLQGERHAEMIRIVVSQRVEQVE